VDFLKKFIGQFGLLLKTFNSRISRFHHKFCDFNGHLNCEFHEYTSVARAIGPSVLPHPQVIFPSKTLVFWNLFEFSVAEITKKNQYLPHSESKSYQINSIKSCPSRSFQEHQRHVPIPPKFSASEKKIIQYSRTFAPQVQTS